MSIETLAFTFTQPLKAAVQPAYAWATDYRPQDISLLGKTGTRKIARLNEDTVVLTDVFVTPAGKVTKKKLIRLYPGATRWVNTHISGPNLHSQFIYELVSTGKNSCKLVFTGAQVFTSQKALTPAQRKKMATELAHEDALMWKNLAKTLDRDLNG